MVERWGTWEDTLLTLLGRTIPQPGTNIRHYQLLLCPTFHLPSCLEVEETAEDVVLALTILQDRDVYSVAFKSNMHRGQPAEVAKGRCWEDLVELPPDQEDGFRLLCADVDPWGMDDRSEGERDGIILWLRCEAPGRSRTIYMWSPTRKASPAHHRFVTMLLDLAAVNFGDQRCLDYLASLQRYLIP